MKSVFTVVTISKATNRLRNFKSFIRLTDELPSRSWSQNMLISRKLKKKKKMKNKAQIKINLVLLVFYHFIGTNNPSYFLSFTEVTYFFLI